MWKRRQQFRRKTVTCHTKEVMVRWKGRKSGELGQGLVNGLGVRVEGQEGVNVMPELMNT